MARDLISVQFEDNTGYTTYSNDDVVGVVLPHCWGPCGSLSVMSRDKFKRLYPLSLPFNSSDPDKNAYLSYVVNVMRAFDMGASEVEVFRPADKSLAISLAPSAINPQSDLDYWKKLFTIYEPDGTTPCGSSVMWEDEEKIVNGEIQVNKDGSQSTKSEFTVYLKYPGLPPKSIFSYDDMGIRYKFFPKTESQEAYINLQVLGYTASTKVWTIVEEFEGGIDVSQVVDGEVFYLDDKVNGNSSFIQVDCNLTSDSWVFNEDYKSEEVRGFNLVTPFGESKALLEIAEYTPAEIEVSDIADAYRKYFSDRKKSVTTILVPTVANEEVYQAIQEVAQSRMNCVAIVGSDTFKSTVESALTYKNSLLADKFSYYINASEIVTALGRRFTLDGTCGYAGRLAYTARTEKLNQLPSADAYGSYNGTLVKTLDYQEVLELHDDGVNSMFLSSAGPQIFGIKSLHPRLQSYYSKFNVSRVLSFILAQFYQEIDQVIHTDVVADDTTRESFQTRLNSVLQAFAPDNIRSNSNVVVESNDEDTKGGELLIITAEVWFKKVVEKATIVVVATDSSITTKIS